MIRVRFLCPACSATVLAPASLEGKSFACPKCNSQIPSWPAPVSASAPAATHPPHQLVPPTTSPATSGHEYRTWAAWVGIGLFVLALFALPVIIRASREDLRIPPPAASSGSAKDGSGAVLETRNSAAPRPAPGNPVEKVEITGTVDVISMHIDDFLAGLHAASGSEDRTRPARPALIVQLGNGVSATCSFEIPTSDTAWYYSLERGDRITIRGTRDFEGYGVLQLSGCEYVSHTPRWRR